MSVPVILDEATVRRLITTPDALSVARETLLAQARGEAFLSTPAAMSLDASRARGPKFKVKAATVGHMGASGIRLLPGAMPDGTRAPNYCAVYDHDAGAGLTALVSESWLSRIRTAAFGVASAEGMLPDRPVRIGLFGTGEIADEIVPLFREALDVERIRVLSRNAARVQAFVERHRTASGLAIEAGESGQHVVADADLVVTLTEATTPLVGPGQLGKDAILMSMGSHNEVDFRVLGEAETFVVDDPDYATDMGDGGAWVKQGNIARADLQARIDWRACDIAAAFHEGRRTQTGRTVALIQGMAIGDVAFAVHVMRKHQQEQR